MRVMVKLEPRSGTAAALGRCLSVLIPCLAALSPAHARPASLEGKWRLNLAELELLPEEEKPAELVMDIQREEPGQFRWVVTVRMADGSSGQTMFVGAIDGKPYPIQGRPGSTSRFSWTPEGSLKQVSESAGGFSVEICEFSGGTSAARPARMTCSARQTDQTGRAAAYVEVFDRI